MYIMPNNKYHVLQTIFLDNKIEKDYKVFVVDSEFSLLD